MMFRVWWLLGLGMPGLAPAATILQTYTQPQSATTWSVAEIAFQRFNPVLGLLRSATLAFDGGFVQTEMVTVPVGAAPQMVSQMTAFGNVRLFAGANFGSEIANIAGSAQVIAPPGVVVGPGTTTFSGSGRLLLVPAALLPLEAYMGDVTISFSMLGTSGLNASGGAAATFGSSTLSRGTLSLLYEYDPAVAAVPEPSTLGLVAMGVALVGLLGLGSDVHFFFLRGARSMRRRSS